MARKHRKSKRYTLAGVDGNAFCVMAYVKDALDDTGHGELVKEYLDRAVSSDYNNLLAVSCKYLAIVNGGHVMGVLLLLAIVWMFIFMFDG